MNFNMTLSSALKFSSKRFRVGDPAENHQWVDIIPDGMHVYCSAPGSYEPNPKAKFEIHAKEAFKQHHELVKHEENTYR